LLAVAGLLAGAMNAIAGGGSFISFPAMVAAGLPAVFANASSTVALFPGTLACTWAYRRAFASVTGLNLCLLVPLSLAGGLAGAILLLATPTRLFDAVIPLLLLLATLTFALGTRAGLMLRRAVRIGPTALPAVQFAVSIYGGYFGGAVGLMMMATWSLLRRRPEGSGAGARSAGEFRQWRRGAVVHRGGGGRLVGNLGDAGRERGRRLLRRPAGAGPVARRRARLRGGAERDGHRGVLSPRNLTGGGALRHVRRRSTSGRNAVSRPISGRNETAR
jgi:hypothetical protein